MGSTRPSKKVYKKLKLSRDATEHIHAQSENEIMSRASSRAQWRSRLSTGLQGIAIAVSLIIAASALAAPQAEQRKSVADRKAQAGRQVSKPATLVRTQSPGATAQRTGPDGETASRAKPAVAPPVSVRAETAPAPAATSPAAAISLPATPTHGEAALGNTHAPTVNPYLAGWFTPTPVSEIPNLAVQQLNVSAQWAIQSVTTLPGKVVDLLPSIKRVFPTGGRELWVVNGKCPVEMVTGQYLLPANVVRDAISGLLETINESRLLAFDIQLVCS